MEAEERERLLANHRNRPQERPDQDAHGRYCLACGIAIPPERVARVNAVRCVDCQHIREKQEATRVGRYRQ
ncbi:TraR/DksA C4-type zinc finger protein [Zobellella denitrificans]|uniref:TraR/DksA C4-type zinc finger protein n=1 Tax=Zobellella denitrificans TaxID=347534 RepID=UPI0038CD9BE9